MFENFRNSLFLLIVLVAFAGCKKNRPVDILAGERTCAHCQMTIVDMKFHAQAITANGKVFPFDSVECMVLWNDEHPEFKSDLWFRDYQHPDQWLASEEAVIVTGGGIRSPMGASLAAVSRSSANDLNIIAKDQLLTFIRTRMVK